MHRPFRSFDRLSLFAPVFMLTAAIVLAGAVPSIAHADERIHMISLISEDAIVLEATDISASSIQAKTVSGPTVRILGIHGETASRPAEGRKTRSSAICAAWGSTKTTSTSIRNASA